MLDLPIRNDRTMDDRMFEAFTEHLPPQGTPTTIILKPIVSPNGTRPHCRTTAVKPSGKSVAITKAAQEQAEKKAIAAATAWLALVDRGEYGQGWETAAGALKDAKERRDFIKTVGDVRKPLGVMKSQEA